MKKANKELRQIEKMMHIQKKLLDMKRVNLNAEYAMYYDIVNILENIKKKMKTDSEPKETK